jgi:hypothetical protein
MKFNLINRTSLILVIFVCLVAALIFLATDINTNKAHAQSSGEWENIATIIVGQNRYIDSDPYDNNLNYKLDGVQDSCVNEIKGFNTGNIFNTDSLTNAKLHTKIKNQVTGTCQENSVSVSLTNSVNSRIELRWSNESTLEQISGGILYTKIEGESIFIPPGDGCKASSVELLDDTTAKIVIRNPIESNCPIIASRDDVRITGLENKSIAAPPEGSEDSTDNSPSCLNQGGEGSWIICPALQGLDGAISYLDNQVNSLLFVPEGYYNDSNQQLEQVWSRFRDIAYLLLIPTLLIMVIGTALGFQFLDAYTVKRALPRLFIAVIFIAVSLPLLRFLVDTVNILGQGTYGIISSVVTDGEQFTLQGLFDPNPVQGVGVTLATIAAGAVVYKFLIGFFLLLALGVLIQIAVIFVLLAFRQFLIIALIALAPLAILAWIFPGNDKPWKLWWGSLWKLLLIYPIIMALLAIGRVFSTIVEGAPGSQGLVEVILKLVAYIGPFFLIPAAFKYAGGVFANIAGYVNNKEKGPLDRIRKARAKSAYSNYDRKAKSQITQRRADWQNRLQGQASKGGMLRRKALGGLANTVGGYNAQAEDSARRAQVSKTIAEQTGAGRDDEVRALTVNKTAADALTKTAAGALIEQADGSYIQAGLSSEDQKVKIDKNGVRKYKTLGGAWVNSQAVDAAQKRWGNDTYAQQSALAYEMKKATTSEQHQGVASGFRSLAKDTWGMTDSQASGAWIGAAYENQGEKLAYKHTNWETGEVDGAKYAQELYEKRGSYQASQMTAHNFETLKDEYVKAKATSLNPQLSPEKRAAADATKKQIESISESFMSRMSSGGGVVGMEGDTPVISRGSSQMQTTSQGSTHTNESIRDLALATGVYREDSPNDSRPNTDRSIQPPPDIPRQR